MTLMKVVYAQSGGLRPQVEYAAYAGDSVPELSLDGVSRLVAAKRALERVQQAHPESKLPALRLPIDPLSLERALGRPRLAMALKQQGMSPRVYARDLTRLTSALFGIAAFEELKLVSADEVKEPTWEWKRGPHLMIRIKRREISPADSNEFVWISERDAAFVRRHQSVLAAKGLSVSALGLTDQLRADNVEVSRFPLAGGDYLDSTDAPLSASNTAVAADRPLRVLFIGDGGGSPSPRVHHNEAYRIFRLLAAAGLGRRVVVGQVTRPGASLMHMWNGYGGSAHAQQVLRNLSWDYVVLAEHPFYLKDRADVYAASRLFEREIKAVSARVVYPIYGASARQEGVEAIMTATGRSVNAILAPMSAAWRGAYAADSSIGLKRLPGNQKGTGEGHGGPLGAYLQALVFYRMITGRTPIGLPAPAIEVFAGNGNGPTLSSEQVETEMFVIPPREVELLQRVAAALPVAGTASVP